MKGTKKRWLLTASILSAIIILFSACGEKDDIDDELNQEEYLPAIITSVVTDITQTTAIAGGNITDEGSAAVTTRGVCWSEDQNPTTEDYATVDGTGAGIFVSNLSGLTPNTTYYLRAYATGSAGTAYGEQVDFTTEPEGVILYTLTVAANPEHGGTVTGEGEFEEGELVQVSAVPAEDYSFVNWTEAGQTLSSQAGFSYTMPAEDVILTANFEAETSCENCVTDIDGNEYPTVIIGDQEWMAKNLRVTRYSNGDSIPTDLLDWQWNGADYGAYYVHPYADVDGIDSEEEMLSTYGALYNWFTVVDPRNVCPSGWHVPTNEEWGELIDFVSADGYEDSEGLALKATSGWNNDGNGTDNYGFSAVPGGSHSTISTNHNIGEYGWWWCATEDGSNYGWYRIMSRYDNTVGNYSNYKRMGYSVRCVRD